jgi:hypothetical protein
VLTKVEDFAPVHDVVVDGRSGKVDVPILKRAQFSGRGMSAGLLEGGW